MQPLYLMLRHPQCSHTDGLFRTSTENTPLMSTRSIFLNSSIRDISFLSLLSLKYTMTSSKTRCSKQSSVHLCVVRTFSMTVFMPSSPITVGSSLIYPTIRIWLCAAIIMLTGERAPASSFPVLPCLYRTGHIPLLQIIWSTKRQPTCRKYPAQKESRPARSPVPWAALFHAGTKLCVHPARSAPTPFLHPHPP